MGIQYRQNLRPQVKPISVIPKQLERRLGSGFTIPFVVQNNTWGVSSGSDKVKQDMLGCLLTPINRRLGQVDYGSELLYLPFESYTKTFQKEAVLYTKEALKRWVPQITVVSITVDITPSDVSIIVIQYQINGTSVFDVLKLALTYDDSVQVPPGTYTLGGVQLLGQYGNLGGTVQ